MRNTEFLEYGRFSCTSGMPKVFHEEEIEENLDTKDVSSETSASESSDL